MGEWHLVLTGSPWWLVLLIALAAIAGAWRWQKRERAHLPRSQRLLLAWLRSGVLALVAAFLLAPALSLEMRSQERPAVALVLDTSASMAVDDRWGAPGRRLDEAQALALLPAGLRLTTARRAAAIARTAITAGPGEDRAALGAALAAETAIPDAALAEEARSLADALAADRLETTALAAFAERADAAQDAADAALVQAAGSATAVGRALAALDRLSRLERARRLARQAADILADRAAVQWFGAAEHLVASDAATEPPAPAGATDSAALFGTLSRAWAAQEHPGAVLLFSDGRQTMGGDPGPALRSLAARGVTVSAVAIGDPGIPRDAVVAALNAPGEVVAGDTVRLTARWRVHGLDAHPWQLVLDRDGIEVARRALTPSGDWQEERFDRAPGGPGTHRWTATIVSPTSSGDGLALQRWQGCPGAAVDDLRRMPDFPGRAAEKERSGLDLAACPEDTGLRFSGWVVPPQSGAYVFRVTSDDASEVLVAADGDPLHGRTLCSVPGWTAPGEWTRFPTQRSPPLALSAGTPVWIEVLYKQGRQLGHCQVGWELPDGSAELPIPRERLHAERAAGAARVVEADTSNNAASTAVAVVDDPLRVLVLDDGPRWESRFLTSVFERDRHARVERRWRGWQAETLLPAGESLDELDVVVLGDCDASDLGPDAGARLADWVGRHGGFLIAIAGTRAMPAAYGLGPIADLLPVRMTGTVRLEDTGAVLALGAAGLRSPITALADGDEANRRAWAAAPPLGRILRGTLPKPGAAVLLESADAIRSPVAVTQRFGNGRVLWLGTDSTWRWRDRLGEQLHLSFWSQAVRWGLGERLRGSDAQLQMALDRALMDTGDQAELRLRVRGRDGAPSTQPPTIRRERLGEDGRPLAGTGAELDALPVAGEAGIWRLPITGLAAGDWRFTVLHPGLPGRQESRRLAVRFRSARESVELAADPGALARCTSLAHGRTVEALGVADEARRIAATLHPKTLVRRRSFSLWDGLWPVVAVVMLLTIEWAVRRRNGLP